MKPPTDIEIFANKTALVPCILTERAVTQVSAFRMLPDAQKNWFFEHCDLRLRWMHNNNNDWRKWLESKLKRIDPRAQCMVWIEHWAMAFVMNPEQYMERHPHTIMTNPVKE